MCFKRSHIAYALIFLKLVRAWAVVEIEIIQSGKGRTGIIGANALIGPSCGDPTPQLRAIGVLE